MQSFPSDLLDKVRIHLEEEKTQIVRQMNALAKQDPFADAGRLTDNAASDTEASEEFNHDRVTALVEELQAKLRDLDTSLQQIADGTYGFCQECKQMIDTDRLTILPTATLCQSCEQKKKSHTH